MILKNGISFIKKLTSVSGKDVKQSFFNRLFQKSTEIKWVFSTYIDKKSPFSYLYSLLENEMFLSFETMNSKCMKCYYVSIYRLM